MRFRTGDMLADIPKDTVVLITTNSFVKRDGTLVMGRGAAAQAARLWPRLPQLAAEHVHHLGVYGMKICIGLGDNRHLGVFQVKYHFKDAADLALIEHSCIMVRNFALGEPSLTIRINFPGIGFGRLSRDRVQQLLDAYFNELDNVEVWTWE